MGIQSLCRRVLIWLLITSCATSSSQAGRSPYESPLPSATAGAPALATSTPQAAATATATASASELIAVAKVVYPYSAQYGYYTVCGLDGDLSQCPMTDRLKAFLTRTETTLCGCQNPAPSMDAAATPTGSGGVAHVVLGYQSPLRFDLVIVREGTRLLVDDQLCTGSGASSSIYIRSRGC